MNKYSHMAFSDRIAIKQGLYDNESFKDISIRMRMYFLITNHINSVVRDSLKGHTPFDMAIKSPNNILYL